MHLSFTTKLPEIYPATQKRIGHISTLLFLVKPLFLIPLFSATKLLLFSVFFYSQSSFIFRLLLFSVFFYSLSSFILCLLLFSVFFYSQSSFTLCLLLFSIFFHSQHLCH
ncbi:hypothetical protein HDV64DRAFT_250803 [Trichoderma sp. TUCIM 5745]